MCSRRVHVRSVKRFRKEKMMFKIIDVVKGRDRLLAGRMKAGRLTACNSWSVPCPTPVVSKSSADCLITSLMISA